MSTTPNSLSEYVLECPKCRKSLYIRHSQGGPIGREQGKHYVVNVNWQAECHSCQWESPKRGTEWALIRTVLETPSEPDTSENAD